MSIMCLYQVPYSKIWQKWPFLMKNGHFWTNFGHFWGHPVRTLYVNYWQLIGTHRKMARQIYVILCNFNIHNIVMSGPKNVQNCQKSPKMTIFGPKYRSRPHIIQVPYMYIVDIPIYKGYHIYVTWSLFQVPYMWISQKMSFFAIFCNFSKFFKIFQKISKIFKKIFFWKNFEKFWNFLKFYDIA